MAREATRLCNVLDYFGREVIQDVSAKRKSKVYSYAGLYLWLLRLRSIIPAFLFIRGGTGMPGDLQGPVEEGAGRGGGTYQ